MADSKKFPTDEIAVAGYKLASLLARITPSPILAGASNWVGGSLSKLMKENGSMVKRHLQRVDPDLKGSSLNRAMQLAFQSYTRYYLETFQLPSISHQQIAAGHQVEGFEHIERAASQGKGTILALPHMGGWEWSGRWLIDQGFQLTAVVERLENTHLFVANFETQVIINLLFRKSLKLF